VEVLSLKSGKAGRTEVDTSFLGEKVLTRTLKSAVIMYEANKRVGTHDTLTRAEVARAKRPLFKQKHTGRARVRHPQVPQCRGGGVAHGPHPRDYSYSLPRKALKVALKSAILSKFRDGQVALVEAFDLDAPKTKALARTLADLKFQGSCLCLIVVDQVDKNLLLSARNLPGVRVAPVSQLNAYDVVFHRNLVITRKGLEKLKEAHADG
jgi:large subunit ribosomal protein L4